jgi:hypothetical protein
MPQYDVKPGKKGFYNGTLYEHNGKRPILVTDEPIPEDKIPSWVTPRMVESVAAATQAGVKQKIVQAHKAKKDAETLLKQTEAEQFDLVDEVKKDVSFVDSRIETL